MTKLPVSSGTGLTQTKDTKNYLNYLVESTGFLCFSDFFFGELATSPQTWDWLIWKES